MNFIEWIVAALSPALCVVCGKEPDPLCVRCIGLFSNIVKLPTSPEKAALAGLWAVTEHSGYAKQLVHDLKFARLKSCSRTIATLMAKNCPTLLPRGSLVVYAPTASRRIRQRGYDQSYLIARSFAKKQGLKFMPALKRHGNFRQVGQNRANRKAQMKGAFYFKKKYSVKNRTIILIDDVVTTGSTLNAAAEVLMAAGASKVIGYTFAYKP